MARHQEDLLYVTNPTDEPFTDTYGKVARTLTPKQRVIWPRYIAEHFAKHLADKMLLQMEKQEELNAKSKNLTYKPRSLLNSSKHRPEVVAQIITGTYQYFEPGGDSEQARVQAQIDALNTPEEKDKALDLGDMPDPLMGNLQPPKGEPEEPAAPVNPPLPTNPPAAGSVPLPPGAGQPAVPQVPPQAPVQPAQPVQQAPAAQPAGKINETPQQRLERLRGEADALGIDYPKTANSNMIEKMIKDMGA